MLAEEDHKRAVIIIIDMQDSEFMLCDANAYITKPVKRDCMAKTLAELFVAPYLGHPKLPPPHLRPEAGNDVRNGDGASASAEAEQGSPQLAQSRCTILLVDDQESNRVIMKQKVAKHAYHNILFARDGEEAVRIVRAGAPKVDCIFTARPPPYP